MTSEIVSVVPDEQRQVALLKAVGLDRYPREVQELAINIASRYGLDLMLKHLVIIEGRPYITRDGLLHVAHRSGQFDGIEVTDPVLDGDFWRAKASVWRKDMSHPFTYSGRYPKSGGNNKFAPEMAIKVSEVMSLRRAFDVSAPVMEERWDVDADAVEPLEHPSARDVLAERAAAVRQLGPVIAEREREGTDGAPSTAEREAEALGMATQVYTEWREEITNRIDPTDPVQVGAFFDAMPVTETSKDPTEAASATNTTPTAEAAPEAASAVPVNAKALSLTKRDLNERIIASKIRLPDIKAVATELFGPGGTLGDLTDEQRGLLWERFAQSS